MSAVRDPAPDPGADVVDLTVAYPGTPRPALDGVTVRVPRGGALLVVGLSGSGKSTLVAALAGILGHTLDADVSGTAHLAGVDVVSGGPRAAARVAGLVQQDPVAQTCLDVVTAEVELALENRAVDPDRIDAAVADALAAAGAADLVGRRTGELSGGQLQRVALAAALATRPRVLLTDEPTALLDPRAAREVGGLVGRLAADGTTSVVVEHRLDALDPLPARTLVLDAGRVVTSGPTEQVLREHGARLTAGGCWVPTRTLLEVAGAPGPLHAPETARWLGHLAAAAPTTRPAPAEAAEVVLDAARLRVDRTARPDGPWSRRRRTCVVRDVDLRLARGEVVGVVGANGSGKSTLLRGLAGLEATGGALRAGRTALVVQHPEQQLLRGTVADEVAHGPRRAGLGEAEVRRRVAATLDRFGLAGLADRSPYRLSGGQQRRLSLATAVVHGPEVLLADEPTFGLDRAGALDTAALLRELADGGAGVVVVSHDLELLARCVDRLLVLADGRVRALGPATDVLADGDALAAAGLERTALLDRWAALTPRPDPRALLAGLDAAVAARGRRGEEVPA